MKTAYDIIIKPVVSEGSMADVEKRKYTFKVAVDAFVDAPHAAAADVANNRKLSERRAGLQRAEFFVLPFTVDGTLGRIGIFRRRVRHDR